MAKGEDDLYLPITKEEGDTDPFEKELKWLIQMVGEWKETFIEMQQEEGFEDRGSFWTIKMRVKNPLEKF